MKRSPEVIPQEQTEAYNRTKLAFDIFDLDIESPDKIKSVINNLLSITKFNKEFFQDLKEIVGITIIDEGQLSDVYHFDSNNLKNFFAIVVEKHLTRLGVDVNSVNYDGKSFMHKLYDFTERLELESDIFFDELLSSDGKDDSYPSDYPWLKKYSLMCIDQKFLESVDWYTLLKIRMFKESICPDSDTIKDNMQNTEYKTQLCMEIVNNKCYAQSNETLKKIVDAACFFEITNFIELEQDLDELSSSITTDVVTQLLTAGVDINRQCADGKSLTEKCYCFLTNSTDEDPNFFRIIETYSQRIKIDKSFLNYLLDNNELDDLKDLISKPYHSDKYIMQMPNEVIDTIDKLHLSNINQNTDIDFATLLYCAKEIQAKMAIELSKYMLFSFKIAKNSASPLFGLDTKVVSHDVGKIIMGKFTQLPLI